MLDHLDDDLALLPVGKPVGVDEIFGQTEEEFFGVLEPTYDGVGQTEPEIFGGPGSMTDLTPTYDDGSFVSLGGPFLGANMSEFVMTKSRPKIAETANSISMGRNKDSITLRVLPPYTEATFIQTTTWQKFKDTVTGKKGKKIDSGTDEKTYTLKQGETRTITLKEGKVDEGWKDRWYDRDISIKLMDSKKVVTTTDKETGETSSEIVDEFSTQQGSSVTAATGVSTDTVKWAFGAVVVLGLVGGAVWYLRGR